MSSVLSPVPSTQCPLATWLGRSPGSSPGGQACGTLPHRQGDDIVVLPRGLPPAVPAPLNGGNEGPRDKASLVPAATQNGRNPHCVRAPYARPPLARTGHANKQLIEPRGGARRQQCPPSGQGCELSWRWGLPSRPESDDLSWGGTVLRQTDPGLASPVS